MVTVSRSSGSPYGRLLSVTLRRPSNFHAHFRRGPLMQAVTPEILRHVKYALAMPNTGPIKTYDEALAYFDELMRIAEDNEYDRLSGIVMTLYHTAEVTSDVIARMALSPIVRAVKHYPPHPSATTGAGHGIPLDDPRSVTMLRAMEDTGVPLLGHFESVVDAWGRDLPHADREGYMVKNFLWKFRDKYPELRICFEHASTKEAVEFVKADTSGRTVMTVTPQHLMFTDDDLERLSWRNHLKCMPQVKSFEHRNAVLAFATSGDDTAPHPSRAKNVAFDECASGCWLPHAIAFYTALFDLADALDERFERFMSLNGPRWWGLAEPDTGDTITVKSAERDIPDPVNVHLPEGDDIVIPLGWSTESDRLRLGYGV